MLLDLTTLIIVVEYNLHSML